MMLLDLPNEVLCCIAENLGQARDILSFACVSKETKDLLLSALYQFNIQRQDSSALCWAAQHGQTRLVEHLVRQYWCNVNAVHNGNTPLIYAAIKGSTAIVNALLSSRQVRVNMRNPDGECALWCAALGGHEEVVAMLLKQPDIDVNIADGRREMTPLAMATMKGHAGVVQSLLATEKININSGDRHSWTPVFHAVARAIVKSDESILKMILEKQDADLTHRDNRGSTPLQYAVWWGQPSLTELLLNYPRRRSASDLDTADTGLPPLCLAACQGNVEIVRLLLDYGWDVNEMDGERLTPLHFAAENGQDEVVQVLLDSRQLDVNARDECGSTALHYAARDGHLDIVHRLLGMADIDINSEDRNGCTPLWCATRNDQHGVAWRLLAEKNVNVNAVGQLEVFLEKSTSLHHAVDSKSLQIVQRLVADTTLNPNITDRNGRTPLSCAAQQGDQQIVECLLRRPDVRVNAVEDGELPPLWLAASHGHVQVVQRLLQCPQIDVNQGWAPYLSPLRAAIKGDHLEVAMQLLRCGPRLDVNARTYLGESALSLAASKGHLSVVEHLLKDRRIDPNDVDKMGRTAFWWAARAGQATIVERLLEDDRVLTHLKDGDGMDPLDAARRHNHLNVALLLQGIRCSSDGKRVSQL
ncbi:hypothetical protein NYO67_4605 [Aspergillus flavus]|nr:hypothetical protein NYO67_4605 [Aspergillus flavus]